MTDSNKPKSGTKKRSADDEVLHGKTTDVQAADNAADLLREGAVSVIQGCRLIAEAVDAREGNKAALHDYVMRLAMRGVLSVNDAGKGIRSPALSMHRTVGRVFTDKLVERTKDRLPSGVSTLYALAELHNRVAERGSDADDVLCNLINNAEEPITRKFVKEKKQELLGPALREERAPGIVPTLPDGNADTDAAPREPYDCVVIDARKQMKRFRTDFHNPGTLERCLGHITLTPEGRLIVLGKVMDLGCITDTIVNIFGLSAKSVRAVLLTREFTSPDISQEQILVVASKGEIAVDHWTFSNDAKGLAELLSPGPCRRLALFGGTEWEGWENLLGDDGWLDIPETSEA